MTRIDRWLFGVLVLVAVLVGVNLYPAVGSWITAWRAVDQFGLSLTSVHPSADRSAVTVGFALLNRSGVPIQILEINAAVQINGHTVAYALQSPDNLTLAGDERRDLFLTAGVGSIDRSALVEQLGARSVEWDISGQVQILISGQSDPTWVPYSGTVSGT